ncbi:MAG: hypothetical protein DRO00_09795 [Thermoproteota archaeon]|nr:MAG: hypothetical protein DRO00_09795 [Candidatus Korarchaeota archaeon]
MSQKFIPKEFEKIVRTYLKRAELSEEFYLRCIDELKKVELHKITEDDVRRVIEQFLIMWGEMRRVLSQKKRKCWQKRLAMKIREIANLLKNFRKKDLLESSDKELNELKKDIESCYSAIKEIIGPTSAAKTLHMIAPNFFPLWDSKIRDSHGIKGTDERAYFHFMQRILNDWSKRKDYLKRISEEFGESKLRIIDIYNWLEGKKDTCY